MIDGALVKVGPFLVRPQTIWIRCQKCAGSGRDSKFPSSAGGVHVCGWCLGSGDYPMDSPTFAYELAKKPKPGLLTAVWSAVIAASSYVSLGLSVYLVRGELLAALLAFVLSVVSFTYSALFLKHYRSS